MTALDLETQALLDEAADRWLSWDEAMDLVKRLAAKVRELAEESWVTVRLAEILTVLCRRYPDEVAAAVLQADYLRSIDEPVIDAMQTLMDAGITTGEQYEALCAGADTEGEAT